MKHKSEYTPLTAAPSKTVSRLPLLGALMVSATLALTPSAWAAKGTSGHSGGSGHDSGHDSGHSDGSSHSGGAKKKGQGGHAGSNKGGGQGGQQAGGQHHGKGGKNLEDIFKDVAGSDAGDDSDAPDWAGRPGGKSGMGGGKPADASAKKGDLYGDMWVIARDANGVPILKDGFVQPLDSQGNLIELDDEGHPVDETLTMEVELGRLNVGRAPSKVLDRRAEEVISLLNEATAVTTDPAGRLVITNADNESKTIDSPLENLALYVALMTTGTIPGVTDLPGDSFDHLVDGERTTADMVSAASLLAGASDKTSPLTVDEIAYVNVFVDINTEKTGSVTYSVADYSAFAYDRSDTYGDVKTTVLVQQGDGNWLSTEVNVYEAVFGGADYSSSGTISTFTQAADDARAIVNFIHEYEVPVTSLETSAVTQ